MNKQIREVLDTPYEILYKDITPSFYNILYIIIKDMLLFLFTYAASPIPLCEYNSPKFCWRNYDNFMYVVFEGLITQNSGIGEAHSSLYAYIIIYIYVYIHIHIFIYKLNIYTCVYIYILCTYCTLPGLFDFDLCKAS